MIRIEYIIGQTLNVVGHAEYDEPGKDIVCAGVSALVYAAVKAVDRLQEQNRLKSAPTLHLDEGYACISAAPLPGAKKELRIALNTVFDGLYELAKAYPDRIKII